MEHNPSNKDNEQQSTADEEEDNTVYLTDTSEEVHDEIPADSLRAKELLFISLVSQEEFLFNPGHKDYRNFKKKDQKWHEIGERVGGWTESQCKTKWKAFRDQYCRELKKSKLKKNRKIRWKYYKDLEYIRPYALTRKYRERLPQLNVEQLIKDVDVVHNVSTLDEERTKFASIPIVDNSDYLNMTPITLQRTADNTWTYVANNNNTTNQYNNGDETKTTEILTTTTNLRQTDCVEQTLQQEHQHQQTVNDALYNAIEDCMKEMRDEEQQQKQQQEHHHVLQQQELLTPSNEEDDDPIHTFLNIENYFEKKLITLISKHNVLYDKSHHDHRNFRVTHEVWEEIARKLNKTVKKCRSKWKALRDQFIREYKRLKDEKNAEFLPKWKYYDDLMFLQNFIKIRITKYNSPKLNNNSTITIVKQDEELEEEEMKVEMNDYSNSSEHHCDHMCTAGLEEYDQIDIDNYMITDSEVCEEYYDEDFNDTDGKSSHPELQNSNNLQEDVNPIILATTTNQEYKTEHSQQIHIPHIPIQQLITNPQIEIKDITCLPNIILSTNSTNNIPTYTTSTTTNHNNSYQYPINENSTTISSATTALDIYNAPVLIATSTKSNSLPSLPPTPQNSIVRTKEFISNNNLNANTTTTTISTTNTKDLENNTNYAMITNKVVTEEDDEIGKFFNCMAMKVRNAKLSELALTELEIDVLNAISYSLKRHK